MLHTDPTPNDSAPQARRRATLLLLGSVAAGVLIPPFLFWRVFVEPKQRYKRVAVGMSVDEVIALFGETHRHTMSGEPLKPPVVSVPAGVKYSYAYTWLMWDRFVYVLFDDNDRVVAVYTYDT